MSQVIFISMKQIIKKALKEMNDFKWIKENPIEIGKCFIINDYYRSLNAVVTIKEIEQREWEDNIYQKGGKFKPTDVIIHLVGVTQEDKKDVGPNFRITYNELVEDINDDYLIPTNCK